MISSSPQDTKALAARLARKLRPGDVVMLLADLGAGKTTFVQGFVEQLGVKETALSPTFVIAQTLQGKFPIHHLDFYRVSAKEILDIGIQDYLTGAGEIPKGIVLIEWADRFREIWPKERVEVHIRIKTRSTHRKIQIRGIGKRLEHLSVD